ncbi:MAG: phosphopantetheine-binding protein [Kofleriaceae bacterium]
MNKQEIIRDAIATLSNHAPSDIRPVSRLAEDLGLRSLARVELAVILERRLGMPVRDDQVMRATTVADLERTLGV